MVASRPLCLTAPSARAAPPGTAFTARSAPCPPVSLRTWPGQSRDLRSRTCAAPAAATRAALCSPSSGYHPGAQVPGQLDHQRPGDAARAIDQQCGARPGAERVAKRLVGGQSGNRHGRSDVERHRIRDRGHVRGSGDEPLRPCPWARSGSESVITRSPATRLATRPATAATVTASSPLGLGEQPERKRAPVPAPQARWALRSLGQSLGVILPDRSTESCRYGQGHPGGWRPGPPQWEHAGSS